MNEQLVRTSTAATLTDIGYDVVEADDAEHALGLVAQGLTPDILVSDHLMPGMHGTDLARILSKQLPSLKVLIISGYAGKTSFDASFARLAKPFKGDELSESLLSLERREGPR